MEKREEAMGDGEEGGVREAVVEHGVQARGGLSTRGAARKMSGRGKGGEDGEDGSCQQDERQGQGW